MHFPKTQVPLEDDFGKSIGLEKKEWEAMRVIACGVCASPLGGQNDRKFVYLSLQTKHYRLVSHSFLTRPTM